MQPEIKIEEIHRATLNGKQVKLFKAYRLIKGVYVFEGQFSAPAKTANKDLVKFVD